MKKQGPIFIEEQCGCRVDHGIPWRCSKHTLGQKGEVMFQRDEANEVVPTITPFQKHVEASTTAANAKATISTRYYDALMIEPAPNNQGIVLTDVKAGDDHYVYLDSKQAAWMHAQLARIFGL